MTGHGSANASSMPPTARHQPSLEGHEGHVVPCRHDPHDRGHHDAQSRSMAHPGTAQRRRGWNTNAAGQGAQNPAIDEDIKKRGNANKGVKPAG